MRFEGAAVFVAMGLAVAGAAPGRAAAFGEGFPTAEEAAKALVAAARASDIAGILKILGPEAADLVSTSDKVEDRRTREMFVRKATVKMTVTVDAKNPGQKILEIGADRWPFPIPIVHAGGAWHFDTAKGRRAILFRRVGNNELTALEVCRGYVEAQNEYFERDPAGTGTHQYAQRFFSTEGKRDGLYWKSTGPSDESPVAELVAKAIAEGYTSKGEPYHGYRFRLLKGQGANATGGAMSYMDGDAMTRGFALIAWPADYRKSGVMTFLVDRSGIVYQKDLGAKTGETAGAMTAYDLDSTWKPVAGAGISESTTEERD